MMRMIEILRMGRTVFPFRVSALVAFALGAALAALPAQAQTEGKTNAPAVGRILSVSGAVTRIPAGGKGEATFALNPLNAGDTIEVGVGGVASLALFQTGERFRLTGPGAVMATPAKLNPVSGAKPESLGPPNSRLSDFLRRGGEADFTLPHAARRTRDARATLTPRGPLALVGYHQNAVTLWWSSRVSVPLTLTIQEMTEELQPGVEILRVILPAGKTRYDAPLSLLTPGRRYLWKLIGPYKPGESTTRPTAGSAFRLIATKDAQQADALILEALALPRAQESDVTPETMSVYVYMRFNLLYQARLALQEAVRRAPEDAGLRDRLAKLNDALELNASETAIPSEQ